MKKIKVLNKINVYCDMDGVIADFNGEPNALERFKVEKGFFNGLKPMNEFGFKQLLANDQVNLYILSISPNKQADKDKRKWLKRHYPQIKNNHIIILRSGQKKHEHRKTSRGVLLDDYGKNCREWQADGNVAIKIEKPLEQYFHEFLTMEFLDF